VKNFFGTYLIKPQLLQETLGAKLKVTGRRLRDGLRDEKLKRPKDEQTKRRAREVGLSGNA
jgi:hypothetical protein